MIAERNEEKTDVLVNGQRRSWVAETQRGRESVNGTDTTMHQRELARTRTTHEFWSKYSQVMHPFISAEMRQDMYDMGTVFDVIKVRTGKTKFNDRANPEDWTWFVDIEVNGAIYTLGMARNDVRDTKFYALKEYTDRGAVISACFETFETTNGQAWDLIQPPYVAVDETDEPPY